MTLPNVGYTTGCGGNVFVETNSSLTVRESTFSSGYTGGWGGGLCVYDATWLKVEGSKFVDNDQGISTHWQYPRYSLPNQNGMDLWIYNSTFEGNSDETIMASAYGIMPKLHIQQTSFVGNERGVTACCEYNLNTDVVLCDNIGVSEDSPWCEHGIHVYGMNSTDLCIPFDEDYP
jgi:hypothetical protein